MTTLKCGGQGTEFSACIVDQRSVEDCFVPTAIVTALKSQWENFIFVFLHLVDSNCLSAPSSHSGTVCTCRPAGSSFIYYGNFGFAQMW